MSAPRINQPKVETTQIMHLTTTIIEASLVVAANNGKELAIASRPRLAVLLPLKHALADLILADLMQHLEILQGTP